MAFFRQWYTLTVNNLIGIGVDVFFPDGTRNKNID